jgi:hypothetical protein
VTTPTPWEMAATAGEEPPKRKPDPRPGTPEYRAALRAVETKAYRWLLARLGLR